MRLAIMSLAMIMISLSFFPAIEYSDFSNGQMTATAQSTGENEFPSIPWMDGIIVIFIIGILFHLQKKSFIALEKRGGMS